MCSAFQLCAGRMLAEWKCLISSRFQEFPHKRIPLFCHCSSEPIMSVTLSAGVFSLLPAAVGFSAVIKIAFAGSLMEKLTKLEKSSAVREGTALLATVRVEACSSTVHVLISFPLIGAQNMRVGCHGSSWGSTESKEKKQQRMVGDVLRRWYLISSS